MRSALSLVLLVAAAGCSAALDFESEIDLPCPCLPDSVCLTGSNRCVPRGSVDDFKSCDPTAQPKDDQCKPNSTCVNLRRAGDVAQGTGAICMPRCSPIAYTTPGSSASIAAQCPRATTCWPLPGGGPGDGVCFFGICETMPNSCPAAQQCVAFNGAGICFTGCQIFNDGCVGPQACHPIGASSVTACVSAGTALEGELCSETNPCVKLSGGGAPLVCDKPANTTDNLRCRKICQANAGNQGCAPTESCQFARPSVEPAKDLGLCIPRG